MPKGVYVKSASHKRKLARHLRKLAKSHIGKPRSLATRRKIARTRLARKIPGLKMEANPRWKGGKWKRADGYVFVRSPGHPHANWCGYVREHILVMTQHLGRALVPGEVVHHINGDRSDNSLSNLVLMTRGSHCVHHKPRLGTGKKRHSSY